MNRNKIFLVALLSIIAVMSCKKEEEELLSLTGDLSFSMPAYCVPGEKIDLLMSGVTGSKDIEFYWTATHKKILTDTIKGATLHFTIADTVGTFAITAHAKAEGYYSKVKSMSFDIIKFGAEGTLTGVKHGTTKMTDSRDSKEYYYTEIGNLYWFEQNLNYAGTADNIVGAPYENAEPLAELLGRLYTWDDATGGVAASGLGNGPQGVCPDGWSVPTKEDWEDLAKNLNKGVAISFDEKWIGLGSEVMVVAKFNDKELWPYSPNNDKNNMYNWNALSSGHSNSKYETFDGIFTMGMWWCSAEKNEDEAYYRYIYYNQSYFDRHAVSKSEFGSSVRCVKLVK